MIRIQDFERSLRFYVDGLEMSALDRFDIPLRRVTAQFIGFDGYDGGGCLELVCPWDADGPFTHGTGYGHISIGVPDMPGTIARLEAAGVVITTPPTVLLPGGPHVAFVSDPDGYSIELIETRAKALEP
jgi:lactoylglutathione lyase